MLKSLDISTVKTAGLVAIYNKMTGKDIKKFTDRATAEARVNLILKEQKKIIVGTPDNPDVADAETKVRSTTFKTAHNDGWVIASVAPNPKREGADAFARYALYKVGMTVGEYLAACEALGQQLNGEPMPRYRFRADLKWDEEHGYITFNK